MDSNDNRGTPSNERNAAMIAVEPSWKVDRVLANQRLNLTAASQVASNVPKAWFLVLGCNRQDGKGVS